MIEHYSFGNIVVNGKTYTDDIKIIRGNVVPGWWRKRGHWVDVDDIQDILKAKPAILIIGKGSPGQMKASGDLCKFLEKNKIEMIAEKTSKAVETFNRFMKEGVDVSAGFHLSC